MAIQSRWLVSPTTYFSSLGFVCLPRMKFAIPLITIGCKSLWRVCRIPHILPINVRLHLLKSKYVMWAFRSQLKGKIAPIDSFIFLFLWQSKHSLIGPSYQGLLTNVPFTGIWIHPVFWWGPCSPFLDFLCCVFGFDLSSLCALRLILPVSLIYPLLVAPSIFSIVYLLTLNLYVLFIFVIRVGLSYRCIVICKYIILINAGRKDKFPLKSRLTAFVRHCAVKSLVNTV